MGNSCCPAPIATTAANSERQAAVKQAPKRYTSRKNRMTADGPPNSLPPKHSQRHLTEEEAASERCVAALRDGEATVFGTHGASDSVAPQNLPSREPLQSVPTQSCLVHEEVEGRNAAFTNDRSPDCAHEPSVAPQNSVVACSSPCWYQRSTGELSIAIKCGGQESSASSGAKKRESISSWTVSQNQLGGGNGEGESFDFTASWESYTPSSLLPVGPSNPDEREVSPRATTQNSPLSRIDDGPLPLSPVVLNSSGCTSTS